METPTPWYRTQVAAVLLLVLFPPAGLYLMWRFQDWDTRRKQITTGASVLWSAAIISAITLAVVLTGGGEEGEEPIVAANPQEAAFRQLEADSERPTNVNFRNGFPLGVHTAVAVEGTDAVERARNFLETYKDLYLQSDPSLALAVRDTIKPGEDGVEYVIFYQTYRGYPVHGGEISVLLDGDHVYATVGGLLSDVVLNTIPAISAREAEDIARDDLGLPDAPIFGDTTLLVFDESLLADVPPDPHLAWQVTLDDRKTMQSFVDAHTGEVLFKYPLGDYDELDLDVSDAQNEANARDDDCYHGSWDPDICDEDDFEEDYVGDHEAELACYCAKEAYHFYNMRYQRDSYDDDGGEVEVYIRATVGNASWSGNCEIIQFRENYVACDVMVHEFTHAVMEDVPLVYVGEQAALEEHIADTFAMVYDSDDWLLGDGRTVGASRNYQWPLMDRWSEATDWDDRYNHAGILNKAASLIAEGGRHPDTGVVVDGVFADRWGLGDLYYYAMPGITAYSSFAHWRELLVGLALTWTYNGPYHPDDGAEVVCSVRNAFHAVEIGLGDIGCDGFEDWGMSPDQDGDGVGGLEDNCPDIFNPGQENTDVIVNPPGDGIGDACDPDIDDDGILGGVCLCLMPPCQPDPACADNCPWVPNPDQEDSDNDGVGNHCDDEDRDGILDDGDLSGIEGDFPCPNLQTTNCDDNCPDDFNPDQANLDPHLDDDGDACDGDADGDGRSDDDDNCWWEPNPGQDNADDDFFGDACDPCPDVPYESLACKPPTVESAVWLPFFDDSDGDGIPDACDEDLKVHETVTPERPPEDLPGPNDYLRPDGESVEVDVVVDPMVYAKIPIEPYWPEGWFCRMGRPEELEIGTAYCPTCFDVFPPDERAVLVLSDLPPNVRAFVSDENGRTWKSRYKDDMHVLRFRPQGGRRYFLYLATGPDVQPGEHLTFSAVMSTAPVERVRPTPSATPTPAPSPTPGPTPSPAPTASPSPARSPTPAPTLAPTATATTTLVPALTATPSPAPTATPPLLPTASPAPTPTPLPTASPAPTPTPLPTALPSPTATPKPTPQKQTVTAIADSWVDRENPTSTSGGSDTTLLVQDYAKPGTARTFVRFDLSTIPSTATVSKATLRLFYDDCDFGPEKVDVGVYEVKGSWKESSLSWNTQPSYAGAAKDVVSLACGGATGVYVEWDVTDLVQEWVSGSASNYGVMIRAVEEVGGGLRAAFGSREGAKDKRPQLVVSYTE